MTPEFLEALLEGDRERAAAGARRRAPGRASPARAACASSRSACARCARTRGSSEWCPHAVVLDGTMIGHAGYHGPPGVNAKQNPDAVEIGYTIEAPYRGHGYATAAATELLRRAEERGIRHFVACTLARQRAVARDHPPARLHADGRGDGRGGRPRARLRAGALAPSDQEVDEQERGRHEHGDDDRDHERHAARARSAGPTRPCRARLCGRGVWESRQDRSSLRDVPIQALLNRPLGPLIACE